MANHFRSGLVLMLSLCLWGSASGGEANFTRSGVYVGAGGAAAISAFEGSFEKNAGFDVSVSGSLGLGVRAGYRLLPFLAAEAQYEWIDGFDVDAANMEGAANVDGWLVTANARVILPAGRVQPFALVGTGMVHLRVRDNLGLGISESTEEGVIRLGAGIDVFATNHIIVSTSGNYLIPKFDVDDFDFVTLGVEVRYQFWGPW